VEKACLSSDSVLIIPADGVFGGLVVHSRDDPIKRSASFGGAGDFDEDKIVFLHDFYHDQSDFIIKKMHNWAEGYRGANIPKMPDAVIMNGLGQEDCARAAGCRVHDQRA
jgi:hypothetical protein